jgi:hypothetical protein
MCLAISPRREEGAMKTNVETTTGNRSGVVPGSLIARWLLWGLPEQLGLAARQRVAEG